jgi:hypothetical protein
MQARQNLECTHIVGNGQFDRWHIDSRFLDFSVGELLSQTVMPWGVIEPRRLLLFPRSIAGVPGDA